MFQLFQAFNCWSVTRVRWMSPWSTTTLAAWPGDFWTRVTWMIADFFVPKWNTKNNSENKILVIWICCDVVFCVQMKCFELKTKQERLQAWCHGFSRDQRSWSHESDLTKIGRNRIIDYPGEDVFGGWLSGLQVLGTVEVQAVNLRGRISILFYISELYPPGN